MTKPKERADSFVNEFFKDYTDAQRAEVSDKLTTIIKDALVENCESITATLLKWNDKMDEPVLDAVVRGITAKIQTIRED